MEALVLFDIDGTLVRRAGPHHKLALVEAVRRVTKIETSVDGIPVQGMLDPDILVLMMRAAGTSPKLIRETMPEIQREAERVYLRSCPDLTHKTCPGARAVLRNLTEHGAVLGLVTGNLTRIGWRKLANAGLKEWFRFGAFGEMARTRARLVRLARRQARAEGWIGRGAAVALVGDAPADIIAAKANGIRSIAVCTGITPREELAAEAPDLLLEDLRALRPGMIYS
ncbi:MAG TPA: HAD family hydrolase [Bryobacteraceae bacterium]|nr:HAD family hydrolase [Bryobacteraceae bacterium]